MKYEQKQIRNIIPGHPVITLLVNPPAFCCTYHPVVKSGRVQDISHTILILPLSLKLSGRLIEKYAFLGQNEIFQKEAKHKTEYDPFKIKVGLKFAFVNSKYTLIYQFFWEGLQHF